ncbi:MAG: exonuclease domain-containing protein [Deltaproteobacteria bacterium]
MNYIVLDLEATCWRGKPPNGINEVIEIGAVKINAYGEVKGLFSKLIKPIVNPVLSGFCKKLTGISQEQINTADSFVKVIEEFQDFIDYDNHDYTLYSWGNNDKAFLSSNCTLHNLDFEWLDPFIDMHKKYLSLNGNKKKSGLKHIVESEGFEFEGDQHSAYIDAYNLSKIFIKYLDEW